MIQLITKGDSQGYLASHVLKTLFPDKEVAVTIDNSYSLSKEGFTYDPEAEVVIILGYPFRSNQTTMVKELLGSKANPFTLILHICSFGEEMDIEYITSIVDEVRSPVDVLMSFIEQGQSDAFISKVLPILTDTTNIKEYVAIGDDYHRYDFSIPRPVNAVDFNDLLMLYGEWFTEEVGSQSVEQISTVFSNVLNALKVNRGVYIEHRLRTADISLAGDYLLAVLYAEEYPNEIAHWIIDQYSKAGMTKIVVLVGDKTKGDDIFRVRTLGAHAGEIAQYLNKGDGKDNVGTVFLGNASKHTSDIVKKMLSQLP